MKKQRKVDAMKLAGETRKLFKQLESMYNLSDTQLIKKLCGKPLGRGVSRSAFVLKLNEKWVVKIQNDGRFENIIESEIWDAIAPAEWWSKWFAGVLWISKTGRVMIQERVETGLPKENYPRKIPRFFTDIKRGNYGYKRNKDGTLDKQLKCVDYANVLGMLTGFMDKKMRFAGFPA